jgi:hypothetical protein
LEDGVVTAIAVVVAILLMLFLIFCAIRWIRPETFALRASFMRLFSLDLEMRLPVQSDRRQDEAQ